MSSEKVVQEDMHKLLQKVPASYYLYIFLQIDEKISSSQHSTGASCNKSEKKGLPLETKNTQNHENRRLGLIESLHMQHCS